MNVAVDASGLMNVSNGLPFLSVVGVSHQQDGCCNIDIEHASDGSLHMEFKYRETVYNVAERLGMFRCYDRGSVGFIHGEEISQEVETGRDRNRTRRMGAVRARG